MAKGKKKTKGLNAMQAVPSSPTPTSMLEYSARSLMRDAMESSPGFKSATGKLKAMAKKLVRGARGKSSGGDA